MLGIAGEIALLIAFVASIAALVAFVRASVVSAPEARESWMRLGRGAWWAVVGGTVVASGILWTLIFG
ncbi:MAG: hypothetical protein AAFQ43_01445, partial [Bacteroidota bacterium]